MVSTSEFRNGLKIQLDTDPCEILEFQHVKPGKGGAFVRTKLRNLLTGSVVDKTFRSGERFEEAQIRECEMQFLYSQGMEYHFMDTKDYEQTIVMEEQIGSARDFLKDNMVVRIRFYQGRTVGVELPTFVELAIQETDPGVRGDTVTGGTKPATLETGAVIKVPLHVNSGERVKIDTRTGSYVERVK